MESFRKIIFSNMENYQLKAGYFAQQKVFSRLRVIVFRQISRFV